MTKQMLREYRHILEHLRRLELLVRADGEDESYDTFSSILRSVEFGWLTPGKIVFRLLWAGRISVSKISDQPPELQRKWFNELDEIEKGRWLLKFANRPCTPNIRVQSEILARTPRRLQQLMKQAKAISL